MGLRSGEVAVLRPRCGNHAICHRGFIPRAICRRKHLSWLRNGRATAPVWRQRRDFSFESFLWTFALVRRILVYLHYWHHRGNPVRSPSVATRKYPCPIWCTSGVEFGRNTVTLGDSHSMNISQRADSTPRTNIPNGMKQSRLIVKTATKSFTGNCTPARVGCNAK